MFYLSHKLYLRPRFLCPYLWQWPTRNGMALTLGSRRFYRPEWLCFLCHWVNYQRSCQKRDWSSLVESPRLSYIAKKKTHLKKRRGRTRFGQGPTMVGSGPSSVERMLDVESKRKMEWKFIKALSHQYLKYGLYWTHFISLKNPVCIIYF